MELSFAIICIVLAIIVLAVIVIAAVFVKDVKRHDDVESEDRNILDALLDEIREKNENPAGEADVSTVDVDRQKEIEDTLREEQARYADEARRLNEENEELKRQLEESAKYTKQLDMKHMQRAIALAEQNKSLKEQISKLRNDFSTELETEKKQFAETIEKEKQALAKQYAVANNLSDTAQMDIETRRRAFAKRLEDSKSVVAQQLDSTYEEVEKLVEHERLELIQKQEIERLEMAQRNNTEKGAYRKMLADLNEENTALEKQLDEERLSYAQKLYDARKSFEAKLKAERISNAKLVATVAHNIEEISGMDSISPAPEPVEVDPEVTIAAYAEPEVPPYRKKEDVAVATEPKKDVAKLIFAEDGVVNLKLVMKDSVKKLEAIVRKYGVGISLQFGDMPDTIVYANSEAINKMVVSLVYDVAESAFRNSTIVLMVKQLGASKYGRGDYEYSCTYLGDTATVHRGPIDAMNGSYDVHDNDDGTKTVSAIFRFELR